MKNMTLKNIVLACSGSFAGSESLLDSEISSIVTDSRAVKKGSLFAAIAGVRTDGHLYVQKAFESGASCALCERVPEGCTGPLILVDSVPLALQSIAAFYRGQFDIPFVGVTGSVGKTTAKELVSSVLGQKYRVHKTFENFNNELGVPLTIFGLNAEHTAAVIEMGISHFGEMRRLTSIVRPDIALFTLIGDAHLEFLGDREGVLRAKSEMLACVPASGCVIVNGDDALLGSLRCAQERLTFGVGKSCDFRAENIRFAGGTSEFDLVYPSGRLHAAVPAYGEHMVYACLAGAAVGYRLGLSEKQILAGIASYRPVGSRARIVETKKLRIIDDCYNANPTSVSSALSSMSKLPGRKVCILGDMLELGSASGDLHHAIGVKAFESGAALVLTVGEEAFHIALGAGEIGKHFDSVEELIAALPDQMREGDVVLVKASHSMHFEKICSALENL